MPRSKPSGISSPQLLLPEAKPKRKRKLKLYMMDASLIPASDYLWVVAESRDIARGRFGRYLKQRLGRVLRKNVEDVTRFYPELLGRAPRVVFSDSP